jgi:hypothetical protein
LLSIGDGMRSTTGESRLDRVPVPALWDAECSFTILPSDE